MVRHSGEDASESKVIRDIAEFGWHVVHIAAEGELVGYSFTIGLFQSYRHPELIVFGLPHQISHRILSIAADLAKSGEPLDLSQPTTELIENYACRLACVPQSEYREHVGYCRWYYEGNDFPLWQIVWPSREGEYPWDPSAPPGFVAAQPVIGLVPDPA